MSAHIIALALQADGLGATDPESHERLAQAAADSEAAWVQALLDEAAQPGIWSLTDPGDADETGGWGGHPADLTEDAAQRAWIALNHDDETWTN